MEEEPAGFRQNEHESKGQFVWIITHSSGRTTSKCNDRSFHGPLGGVKTRQRFLKLASSVKTATPGYGLSCSSSMSFERRARRRREVWDDIELATSSL